MPQSSIAPNVKVSTTVTYNGFPSIVKSLKSASSANVEEFAHRVVETAQQLVAVRTGFLQESIIAIQIDELNWSVEVGASYGAFQEYGTRFEAPHPYLVPAVEQVATDFITTFSKVFS